MQQSQPEIYGESEEVAGVLALAWQELLDAHYTAIWVDTSGEGDLQLLGRAGSFGAESPEVEGEKVGAKATEDSWPQGAFFLVEGDGAPRDLAAQLGLLSDQIAAPSMCVPLDGVGIALFWLDSPDGTLGDEWKPVIEVAARASGAHLFQALRLEKLGRSFLQIGEAVGRAVDGREAHREGFSDAVSFYSGLIAREIGLSQGEIERIEYAGLWHGIGRLSVPEAVLESQQLSESDLETVRAAPVWGAQQLAGIEGLEEIAATIRHQNERYDGSGAPDGLAGENIPLGARILAVATRFAAMTNRRRDRAPLSVVGGAMDELAQDAGGALDPQIVQAFVAAMGRKL